MSCFILVSSLISAVLFFPHVYSMSTTATNSYQLCWKGKKLLNLESVGSTQSKVRVNPNIVLLCIETSDLTDIQCIHQPFVIDYNLL